MVQFHLFSIILSRRIAASLARLVCPKARICNARRPTASCPRENASASDLAEARLTMKRLTGLVVVTVPSGKKIVVKLDFCSPNCSSSTFCRLVANKSTTPSKSSSCDHYSIRCHYKPYFSKQNWINEVPQCIPWQIFGIQSRFGILCPPYTLRLWVWWVSNLPQGPTL